MQLGNFALSAKVRLTTVKLNEKQNPKKLLIIVLIGIISALHYWGGSYTSPIHNFYRLLYYVPIILAALNFGFRGGVITSIVVSFIYSPFILLTLGGFNSQAFNELLDIILFFMVGTITGTLVEKKNISLLRFDDELKRYILLENYTNSIIESINSGVIAVNNDLLITMANKGARILLGLDNECIGQPLTEVGLDTIKDKIDIAISNSQANENIELTLKKGDQDIIIRMNLYPLNYENVKKGLVIILDDISIMKKLQKELLRNEKLAALGELSAGIAHEIRNPLGIIKAIEQTMQKELKENPEAVNELKIIDEEIERANKVIKALMELGRPSKGEKSPYSIDLIIDDVLIITNKYIMQHGVKIEYKRDGTNEALIDKEQMKQAFVNIIFNAVQAMPDGGNLKITTEKLNNQTIRITFEDTGIGIEQNNLNKIFDPFFTTKDGGTGLGLAIVQRIIGEHGGDISVNSKTAQGTSFQINIPVREEINR